MKITKEEFQKYEKVRMDGITNMLLVNNVQALTGLSRKKIFFIMNNYKELYIKHKVTS